MGDRRTRATWSPIKLLYERTIVVLERRRFSITNIFSLLSRLYEEKNACIPDMNLLTPTPLRSCEGEKVSLLLPHIGIRQNGVVVGSHC